MADSHLLAESKKAFHDDDSDSESSTCAALDQEDDPEPAKVTRFRDFHQRFASPLAQGKFFGNKRNQLAAALLAIVALICLIVLLTHGTHGHFKKYKPKLPKLQNKHRELFCTTWPQGLPDVNSTTRAPPPRHDKWTKPQGVKVIAFVFYGRREYVDLLDCYLRRNLVSAGGYLDEVQFVQNARDPEDVKWLDELVPTAPEYKRVEVPKRCETSVSWAGCLWDLADDPHAMYIKIDDDIVFIDEDAIPRLVETRIKNKAAFAIGANIVNAHLVTWSHYHNGAIHPYLPEQRVHEVEEPKITWRASELPNFPANISLKRITGPRDLKRVKGLFPGHRWLRLNSDGDDSTFGGKDLAYTPIAVIDYDRPAAKKWHVAAQNQYSLLENIEYGQLDKYHLGDSDGIWDPQYQRYNINFLAIWGSDVIDNLPFDIRSEMAYDERLLSIVLPLKLGRPFLVDSKAIVSHFSFSYQKKVLQTDLLDRWRAYANEKVCFHKLKRPFGPPCPGIT